MTFDVDYPLFILMDGTVPVIVVGMDDTARAKAFAVFTDREAVEQYRDEYFPTGKLARIPDEESFAKVLKIIKEFVSLVAFDPYRMGSRMQTITVEEMLRQLPDIE